MDKELRTTFQIDDEITLRAFAEGDAEQVTEAVLRNREHLETFMHWMTPDYSIESAKDFVGRSIATVEAKSGLGYGIFRDRHLIGSIGFVYFDWVARKTEMGYW